MNRKQIVTTSTAATLLALTLAWLVLPSPDPETGRAPDPTRAAPRASAAEAGASREAAERAPLAAAARYAYHASVGTELVFTWKGRTQISIGTEDGHASAGPSFDLGGKLLVAVRSRQGNELVAELRGSEIAVTPAISESADAMSQAAAVLRRDLEAGVLVRLGESGEVLGFRFAADTDPENRNWWRTLVAVARVTLAPDDRAEWSTQESDAIGKALVEHSWSGPEAEHRRAFSGRKVRYLDATEKTPRPTVRSEQDGVFDAALGWVTQIRTREDGRLDVPVIGMRIETHAEFAFELGAVRAAAAGGDGFVLAEAGLSGTEDARAAAARASEHDWRQQLERVPTADLVAALAELAKGDLASPELMAARLRLVKALQLWPERVRELLAAVRAGTLDDRATMVVLSALGAAKHEAAQKALAECAAPDQPEKTRVFALRGLFQVGTPEASAAAAALAGARDATSGIVADTSLLLVGAFASRDATQARSLLALEAEAVSGGRLATWLEAVGNSGSAEALPAVARHLGSEDPGIRFAALAALRQMPGDAALEAIERASGDADAGVRSRAVELLGTREETRGLQLVERVLTDDGDADVRIAALRGLLPRLHDAAAVRLFERAASNDTAKTVRDYALSALRRS